MFANLLYIYQKIYDPATRTAKIESDLVAEWRIYEDREENRKKLNII